MPIHHSVTEYECFLEKEQGEMNVLFSISDDYGYVSRLKAIKKIFFKEIPSLQIDKSVERLGVSEISVRRRDLKSTPQPLRLMSSAKQEGSRNQSLLEIS